MSFKCTQCGGLWFDLKKAQCPECGPATTKAQPRIYISGPMTGIEDFNYPAFHAAERTLRALGFEVENPANNPDPTPKTWEGFMRMSVRQICDCEVVVTLPGWTSSRGAKFEVLLGETLGLDVVPFEKLVNAHTTEASA